MAKGTKIFLGALIFVITLLSVGTGFFYAKSDALQKKLDSKKTTSETAATTSTSTDNTTTSTVKDTTTPTTTATPAVTASSADSRPSSPSDTVIVGEKETLLQIGQKVGVSYTLIAEANGIDANVIKIGQTLIVPKNNQIGYTINKDRAAALQKEVDGGKYAFRLTALDTAKADSPSAYGLASTDNFVQDKVDASAGSATVTATKNDKTYLITLVQPVTKGAKGIWAIESIKPQTK